MEIPEKTTKDLIETLTENQYKSIELNGLDPDSEYQFHLTFSEKSIHLERTTDYTRKTFHYDIQTQNLSVNNKPAKKSEVNQFNRYIQAYSLQAWEGKASTTIESQ